MNSFFKAGNSKIAKSVLTFTLPTHVCFGANQQCKNCYAVQPEKMFKVVRDKRQKNLELTATFDFAERAIEQIRESKKKVVRLHESGDFYSELYALKWITIAKALPEVRFYTMTKKLKRFENLQKFAELPNVNVINSITEDGGKNYGDWERVNKLQKDGYFLCPCAIRDWKGCGTDCKMCEHTEKVCFLEHSPAALSAERKKLGLPKKAKHYSGIN